MSMQGPEHEAFVAAAKSEMNTEFVQTTVAEVAQVFIRPPFVALRKPEPEYFSAFGMGFGFAHSLSFFVLYEIQTRLR